MHTLYTVTADEMITVQVLRTTATHGYRLTLRFSVLLEVGPWRHPGTSTDSK